MIVGVSQKKIVDLVYQRLPLDSIQDILQLPTPLIQFAILNELDEVLDALEYHHDDFNQANAVGETIVHHCADIGDVKTLARLRNWVKSGRVNIDRLTNINANFLHYATHITDPVALENTFSLAHQAMLVAVNQWGKSPLSLAIEQDNAVFLRIAFKTFPQLVSLKQAWGGSATMCESLLHDIARSGAQKCFAVLREYFTEAVWFELQALRNQDEEQPIDSAILAGKRILFQMLKGYRTSDGVPTLQWLCALQGAQSSSSTVLPPWGEILCDAKAEVESQNLDWSIGSPIETVNCQQQSEQPFYDEIEDAPTEWRLKSSLNL